VDPPAKNAIRLPLRPRTRISVSRLSCKMVQ
jgi:hypothetical protein